MDTGILISILSLILGFFFGYLVSYFKEKGKNVALIEDLAKITEEKEKVSSKFELEISKRKYKYEDKRTQYFKYFNLLDQLNTESFKEMQQQFLPALEEFYAGFLGAYDDIEKQGIATTKFMITVNELMFKANESFSRFKLETSTMKLIAGPSVSKTLLETEIAYSVAFDRSTEILKDYVENTITGRLDILKQQEFELGDLGKTLLVLKEKLTQEVKNELDEI